MKIKEFSETYGINARAIRTRIRSGDIKGVLGEDGRIEIDLSSIDFEELKNHSTLNKLTPEQKRERKNACERKRRATDEVKRRTKIYNDSEIGRTARRRSHLKRYGLSIDNAVCMLSLQGGRCAICNRSLCDITTTNKKNEAPYVDHNHETGTVRSILCLQCNSGLGYFKDSPELLRTAAAYIERHNQPQVPNALR